MAPSGKTILIAVLIGLAALLIRLPYLEHVPPWIGVNENFIAIEILNGKFHLTNENPHIGALSPYLVAGFLLLFGKHWWVSRLVPLTFGVGTVVLTFLLGNRIYSRKTGIAAAAIMSVAWYHVIFSSHFPWSNSITPFFTTGFLLVFYHSLQMENRRKKLFWSGLAGLLFGLGLQSHPEVLVLVPVIPIVLAIHEKHLLNWLKQPVVYILTALALLGYANMIYYNIMNRFGSVAFSLSYPQYSLTSEYTATSLSGNYFRAFLFLPRMILGYYDDTIAWSWYAARPLIWVFWIAVITGLILHFRKRNTFIPVAFLSGFLLIPILNSNYTLYLGRYLVFLFPLAAILISETLFSLNNWEASRRHCTVCWGVRGFIAAMLIGLIVFPVFQIRNYYAFAKDTGINRYQFVDMIGLIDDTGFNDPIIFVDDSVYRFIDYRQILMEDGKDCEGFNWIGDDVTIPLSRDLQERILTYRDRDIIVAVAPWNRKSFLERIPVTRLLGHVDYTDASGWHDVFQIYEVDLRPVTPWVNSRLLFDSPTRFKHTGLPHPESADIELILQYRSADETNGCLPGEILVQLSNEGVSQPTDLCFGVVTPDGQRLYFPEWTDIPGIFTLTLAMGSNTGKIPVLKFDPLKLPPGDYQFFLEGFRQRIWDRLTKPAHCTVTVPVCEQPESGISAGMILRDSRLWIPR